MMGRRGCQWSSARLPAPAGRSGQLAVEPPWRCARTASSGRGFTLMETILAISLSAGLLLLVASAMGLYSRLVLDRRTEVTNAQVGRAVLQLIAEDLRAAFYVEEEDGGQGAALSGGSDDSTSTDGGADSSADGTSADTADLTNATVTTPGLYGNQFELQLDVLGRFTKPVKYDALTAAGLDPRAANLWSDPKIITYYLRESDPAELVGTPLQTTSAFDAPRRTVLIRRVQSRAEALFSATTGDTTLAMQGEQLLSDQIASLEFEYFDGLQWVTEWDSTLDGGLPVAVRIVVTVVDADREMTEGPVDAADLSAANFFQLTVALPLAQANLTSGTQL